LLQILVLIGIVYILKYGWRRAPFEIWRRTRSFGGFFWNWLRAHEPNTPGPVQTRDIIREVRVKEIGDVNLSTLLSLIAIAGLGAIALLRRFGQNI
jgi:hypothetical protein